MSKELSVESIQNLCLDGAELVVATVDVADMNQQHASSYMENIRNFLTEKINVDVIVIPSNITLTTINGRAIDE